MDKNDFAPVVFETGLGTLRTIINPEEATRYLTTMWPAAPGPKHSRARQVCLAVLKGRRQADEARAAFIEALDEASFHVLPS